MAQMRTSDASTLTGTTVLSSPSTSIDPVDIQRRSLDPNDIPHSTTPLLPPFISEDETTAKVSSPLQSPSVAASDDNSRDSGILMFSGLPSPPLSQKASVSSFNKRALVALSDHPRDEWAHKLGHANFAIQPEPYVPEECNSESFRQLRANWDLARCNFARHLVRTGEHYGITSTIYKLTEEKWDAIDREWKQKHETMMEQLNDDMVLGGSAALFSPCEQVKLPRIHDNEKFPELGDEEIVGPMRVDPPIQACRSTTTTKLQKKMIDFFRNLVK